MATMIFKNQTVLIRINETIRNGDGGRAAILYHQTYQNMKFFMEFLSKYAVFQVHGFSENFHQS